MMRNNATQSVSQKTKSDHEHRHGQFGLWQDITAVSVQARTSYSSS